MSELLIDRLYKFRRRARHLRDSLEWCDEEGGDTDLLPDTIEWLKDRWSRTVRICHRIERRLGRNHPDVVSLRRPHHIEEEA